MLLNRLNLSVAALTSKDATRFTLAGVHITPEYTEATDGHCLGRVSMPLCDTEDFPPCAGVVGTAEKLRPCIVPADAIVALSKSIPTKAAKNPPVLAHAKVDIVASNQNGTFRAVTTDMERTTPIEARKIDGEFPAIDQVIPSGEVAFEIGFNAELLVKVLKVAGAFNDRSHAVKLTFHKEADGSISNIGPMTITATCVDTGQIGTFLVMPMRL